MNEDMEKQSNKSTPSQASSKDRKVIGTMFQLF